MYDITYKGETGRSHGVYISKRPAVPAPKEEIETYVIGGRDGILTGDRRLLPLDITVEFGFRADPEAFASKYREVKRWLSGNGKLIQSDDADWFYKVYYVTLDSPKRTIKRHGGITAKFTCDPYMYKADGQDKIRIDGSRTYSNAYDECHPVFIIGDEDFNYETYGEITVNGKTATISVQEGAIVIDTDRMITYRAYDNKIINNALNIDYRDFWLQSGSNAISAQATMDGSDGPVWMIPNLRMR